MEIKAITRRWGNSIAVIIPKDVASEQNIGQNEEVVITVAKKKPRAGVLFGFLKDWDKSGQEIKDEMRRGWESDSDRKRWKK